MIRPSWFPAVVVVATHNPGKLEEWRTLLSPLGVTIRTATSLSLTPPEETEVTYRGNAMLKASSAAIQTGLAALADDTGFEAEAMGGKPGVHTAPWVDAQGGDAVARDVMLRRAGIGTPACLVCSVAIAIGANVRVAEASIEGVISTTLKNAPGLAALLDTQTPLLRDGVLAHRRAAFGELISQ